MMIKLLLNLILVGCLVSSSLSQTGVGISLQKLDCAFFTRDESYVEDPDLIPMELGTQFGFEYRLSIYGTDHINIEEHIEFPAGGIIDPSTGKSSASTVSNKRVKSGKNYWISFSFDDEWEMVSGTWAFKLLHKGKVLATQKFSITEPPGQEVLGQITSNSIIDKKEAEEVAWGYYLTHITKHGGPESIEDCDGHWKVKCNRGYGGPPMKYPIVIDKSSGKLSMRGYPIVIAPKQLANTYREFLKQQAIEQNGKKASESTTFEILGYIQEYISRFDYDTGDPRENYVESFYPHEKSEADRFEKLLIRYHEEMDRSYMVQREDGSRGHVSFHDEWMSEQINQYYLAKYHCDTDCIYSLNPDFLLKGDKESLKAYVQSVYDREGDEDKKNLIYLANAGTLSETISKALIALGSEWVVIYLGEGIPSSFWIHFDVPECLDLKLNKIKDGEVSLPDYFKEWKRYKGCAQQVSSLDSK